MERNLIIIPNRPSGLSLPSYHYSATQFEFHRKTRFHASSNLVSVTKDSHPKSIEAQLNQLCINGPLTDAVAILDSLARQGSKVRPITYVNLLQSCIDRDCIWVGRELHARIGIVTNLDPFVETKLVSMYAKCGFLEEARKVFDEMRERNLFTWSAMIGACLRECDWEEVVGLFYDMLQDGFLPDEFLIPKILQACGKCRDFETVRLIHSIVIRHGMQCALRVSNSILAVYAKCGEMSYAKKFFGSLDKRNSVTWNAIITGCCQNGEIEQARKYFNAMQEEGVEPCLLTWNIMIASYIQLGHCDIARDLMRRMETFGISPDVYTWTSMISGFTQKGFIHQAFDILREMLLSGVEPNGITIASAVSACASVKSLYAGSEIHSLAMKLGLGDDLVVGNSLIDMYSKCGNLEAAQRVFDMMLERDVYSWNSIIGGYCQAGFCGKAHDLFMKMQESDSPPNVVTWNIMITGYMQNDDEDRALDLLQRIEKDGKVKRNAASWNAIISGYLQKGLLDKGLQIFRQMQSYHTSPNTVSMLSILPACANLVAANKVKEIHCCAVRRNFISEAYVSNIFIDTYAKSGNMMYARKIFDGLSSKDIISWNTLIAGYVLHGQSEFALDLYGQMRREGLEPSRGTFASIILAYSDVGMLDEGKHTFSSISEAYQIRPSLEHYYAMVYLLGRSGKLAEALEFIENMPIEPTSTIWAALFAASRCHRNFGLAILAGERMLELEPGNNLTQLLLSQAYYLCGKSWESPKLTRLEKEKAVKIPLGQCWIERKNMVHTFVVGYQSKTYLDKLRSWLKRVAVNVNASISGNLPSIEEEDEEHGSIVHSEKLAFAFALLDSHHEGPQVLRIVKNLRMCRECHDTAKNLSLAYGCEIYLSDSNCLHHFKGGYCSCQDYCDKSNTPSGFILKLRKHIWTWRLGDVRKLGYDRIILFQFGLRKSANYVIFDLYADGNILLTDANFMVLTLLRSHRVACTDDTPSLKKIQMEVSLNFDDSVKKPASHGPWGGSGGSHWDDGVYSGVRQLVIAHGTGIDSIQIEYDKKGSSIWSQKHGGSGGHKTDRVKLDYPDEFLTSVHGYYGSLNQWGPNFVRSLSFVSNKKSYGPFGVEQGTHFSVSASGTKIVGFHGKCDWYLDAIGVYMKPLKQPSKLLVQPQNQIASTNNFGGFSVIQGSVGETYDIVLAVRQKDNFGMLQSNNVPRKISHIKESKNTEHKEKVQEPESQTNNVPGKISHIKEYNNIEQKEKTAQLEKLPPKVAGVVKYKACGGTGGILFDDGCYTGIRQINLSRNVGIVWIRVLYDYEGESIWGYKQGGTGGFKTDKIVFDFPYEALTHISGYYGPMMYMGPIVIKSLTFHTSKRKYGPFGDEQGTYFTTKEKEGKVLGIHGRKGLFLDAIGVHVAEGKVIVPAATPPREITATKLMLAKPGAAEEVSCGVIKEPAPCGPGPWGGDGGRPWDDGVFSAIKQIYLTKDKEGICSIQIEYDRNKQSVWSVKHGGNGGDTMHRIKLEYPHEVLSCISGYYGSITKDEKHIIIKSLTFTTSRGQYGPYGEEVGKFFTSTTTEGKVVGLHGRSSFYLDAIGVHMQHWLGHQKASRSSLFKLF
ncbi:hypothetical protein HN51_024821 [Arachis hypogaea]